MVNRFDPWGGMPDRRGPRRLGEPPRRRVRRDSPARRRTGRAVLALAVAMLAWSAYDLGADGPLLSRWTGGPSLSMRRAADVGRRRVLAVEGRIGDDDAYWFARAAKAAGLRRGDVVLLSSGGGNLGQGLAIGRGIREAGLDTAVGTVAEGVMKASACASSCVFAYAGGIDRVLPPGSRIGVHRFTQASGGDDANAAATMTEVEAFLRRSGIDWSFVAAMNATDEVRWLDPAELRSMRLVNAPKG